MAAIHIPSIDAKLGALFLADNFSAILFGITSLQTFIYFKNGSRDSKKLKGLIVLLWLLNSFHLAVIIHILYHYTISNYVNPVALLYPTWSVTAMVFVTCFSDFIVRGIFAHRVWRLSGKKFYYVIIIGVPTLMTTAGGIACAGKTLKVETFFQYEIYSTSLYVGQSSGVVADSTIAVSLVLLLLRSHTGFKRTDSVINTLMVYAINTGALTTICRLLSIITFAIWPHELVFMAIYFVISELSLNSLLATLNARESLRSLPTVPVELALRRDPSTSAVSGGDPHGTIDHSKGMVVHISQQVVMSGDELK
ncbi:hypothetical protein ONZ45_g9469 [Pleurotus djamor]|nr:hypothetical protein ONZ45_g9469 [Pleurotus djamor]